MYEAYVDGSYRPLGSAAAVVLYENRKEIFKTVKPLTASSSLAAECDAVMMAANLCWISNYVQPTIYTDSSSVYLAFYDHVKIRNKNLSACIYALKEIEKRFPFTIRQVKRRDVFVPDDMCSRFITDAHKYYQKVLPQ